MSISSWPLGGARAVGEDRIPFARAFGVWLSPAKMLHHAKRRLEARGLEAEFVQADARSLPLCPSSVDHVFVIGVLGEIPDRTTALAEMRRVLRPGGRLSVSEQLPDPDFVTQRALRRELTAAGFAEEKTRGWLFYTSRWSKPQASAGPPGGTARAQWQ